MNETIKREINQNFNINKKYMRASEVANYMGIGLSTVWLYANQGKLTPKKISPRVTVFSIEEVERIINHIEVA